ncbi:MAG: hypothetical protein R3208_11270 [Ketobacteraceae bacterium]|nr:hypothetical protein [Ketobacteraceae bacterium]
MDLGKNQRIRLEPQDEYPHPIESAVNFNESMYINLFDHQQEMGGWFRVGNRPNEGHSEVSCCLYLPDGRVAFMFQRPENHCNDALAAGGMAFNVKEPFQQLELSYSGQICLLEDPLEMANPKQAFANNPMLPCEIRIRYRAVAPVYGGEQVDENGNPVQENPEESFARGHYEQHMAGEGTISVGDQQFKVTGLGLRDHSWGPRYWQNLYWYRWLPVNFTEDFAMNVSIVTMASGKQFIWGMTLEGDEYQLIEGARLSTGYDNNYYPRSYELWAKTGNREYRVNGEVLSLIPLRNRRRKDNGDWLQTRIIEGFTRVRCNGMTGYGMTEYLDQMESDLPVGRDV